MESDSPDDTLLGDVFNPTAFLSSYSYLSIAAGKRLFGQLNFPNIWTQNNIFTQEIQVGVIGQFGVSSQGHCNMPSGQIDDEIPLETNDSTIASTQFVHSVQDAIFASDNTWTGTNTFDSDAFAQTANQNTAQTSTLIATLQYTWDSINTLLNIENTWTFLQHFTSGIETNTATITGLLSSNAITTNTLTISTSATTPNVSQANTPDTSVANTAYIWSSLGTFLGQTHSWPLQQTFGNVLATNIGTSTLSGNYIVGNSLVSNSSVMCVDVSCSNSITANTALFNTACNVPTISQLTTPSTSAASTRYVADSLSSFLGIEHSWSLAQQFLNGVTATNINASTATISSLGSTQMDTQSMNIHPAVSASSSPFDMLQNAFTIASPFDTMDRLVLTASRTQNNGTSLIQSFIDGDSSAHIIYTPLSLNPFGGLIAINKTADATISPNTIALDISGNLQCSGDMSANTCHLTHGLSCESISTIDISASGSIAAYSGTLSQSISLSDNSTRISTTKYVQDNLTNLKATTNQWSGRQLFTNPSCLMPMFSCGYYLDAPGLDAGTPYVSDAFGMYPILSSTRRLPAIGVDNAWVVAPGYKFVLYLDVNYGGFHATIDNYDRTFDFVSIPAVIKGVVSENLYLGGFPLTSLGANHVKSVKVYYQSDSNEVTSLIMS